MFNCLYDVVYRSDTRRGDGATRHNVDAHDRHVLLSQEVNLSLWRLVTDQLERLQVRVRDTWTYVAP